MEDEYRPITTHVAVRILNERLGGKFSSTDLLTGCTLVPTDLLWAEINDKTKTIQFEDRMEGVWRVDVNGNKRRRWVWSDEWTDWVDD